MPAARAVSDAVASKASSRPARTRRPQQVTDADALADDLSRVLRVSRQKTAVNAVPPATRRAPSSAKPASEKAETSTETIKRRTPAAKPRPKATTIAATASARTKATTTTVTQESAPGKCKGKAPAPPALREEPTQLPWMTRTGGMSSRERAQAAQVAINNASRTLAEAIQAKFTYGAASSSKDTGVLTDALLEETVTTAYAGVVVLREIYFGDEYSAQRLTFERGLATLLFRCVAVQMYQQLPDMLATTKPHILRLYSSSDSESTTPESGDPGSGDLTSLARFPPPIQELSEPVRGIINTFIMVAWCCILSVKPDDEAKSLRELIPLPASKEQLHPFNLAPSLPFSTVMPLAGYLYRRVAAYPVKKGSPDWLHLRLLTAISTALTVSVNDSEKRRNSPDAVWHSALNTAESYLEGAAADNAERQVAEFIEVIVNVVESICEHRAEPRSAWYSGHWAKVADVWVGLGRRLGDKVLIDKAMAALRASSIDAEAVQPEGPDDTLSPTHLDSPALDTSLVKTGLSVEAAKDTALRCHAGLAKAFVNLTKAIDGNPSDSGVEAALAEVQLDVLADGLCCLDDSDSAQETLTACLRETERFRRAVVKPFDAAQPQSNLKAMLRGWLLRYLTFAQRLLQSATTKKPCVTALMPGCFDTTLALLRPGGLSKDSPSAVQLLDALHALLVTYGRTITTAQRSNYYFALTQTTHSAAVNSVRQGDNDEAVQFAQRACDWSACYVTEGSAEEDAALDKVAESLPKRYELLGVCMQSKDRVAALKAYCQAVSWITPATVRQIAEYAPCKPLAQILGDIKDADVPLRRCVALLAADDPPTLDFPAVFCEELTARNLSPAVKGILVEQLLDALSPAQHRPLVQATYVQLCDVLLDIYNADNYPIRRMRVNARLLNLIATSGFAANRFDPVYNDTSQLWEGQAAGEDSLLVPCKAELYGCATVLRALNAHHQTPATDNVPAYGKAALGVVRRVVFPPTPKTLAPKATVARVANAPRSGLSRSTATKPAPRAAPLRTTSTSKPVRGAVASSSTKPEAANRASAPRIGDPEQLVQLLSALGALFGICGHTALKIEALNIVRAIQRAAETMIDSYILTCSLLVAEYGRLGKQSRAHQVFSQAMKHSTTKASASAASLVDLHLRYTRFLATFGHLAQAREQFQLAQQLSEDVPQPNRNGTATERWIQICSAHERSALAHTAHASIMMVTADATRAVESLTSAYRQWCRAAAGVAFIAGDVPVEIDNAIEAATEGEDKPTAKKPFCFDGKHLSGLQWHYAEAIFESVFTLFTALAQRGSPKECEFYLAQARNMVPSVGSSTMEARTATHAAELESRRLHFEQSIQQLELATNVLEVDGADAVDIQRLRGELYSRQDDPSEADQMFAAAVERLSGLDGEFAAIEALTPVPSTPGPMSPKAQKTGKEPLLPHALGHLLRQRAWLLREAGAVDEYHTIVQQLDRVPRTAGDKPEQLLLEAKVSLHEAFSHFKTDLFMSSLTESTIAMTMVSSERRAKERHSTRHAALVMLDKSSHAFRKTLANVARTGRVEDVRQACISLVLLSAFQTALGHGSPATTALAAGILASVPALTLHRELLPAIDDKFPDPAADDFDWPELAPPSLPVDGNSLATYWEHIRTKHEAFDFLHADYDLSALPENWAVIGITVTDDRNTMLVSRHQNGHEPIVFCIPLDRQGKREGDDESELFTFDAGVAEFNAIIEGSNTSIKDIAKCKTPEDNRAWWKNRVQLDTRLGELLATIEFCWLGAFKTVLNPRLEYDPKALQTFRERLDRIFEAALSSSGSRSTKVKLNDTLLACFATLSSTSKDEEIEDLVYFVLDVYQFHGIAVALAELDFDQIGVDVKSALSDLEAAQGERPPSDEHLLLALDKNVQGLPWESIPILRGRAVSRIPSLPFLLDQVALSKYVQQPTGHFTIDATRTRFFLNPSGDLTGTQSRFDDRLAALEKRGWTGIRGRAPSSDDMVSALTTSELVMYFGHGGGEQYISGTKVRSLPRCAVTMLWGCSSGILRDQGDLDRTGTPNDYVLAGSPCLVGNLWDVTDKDIDRLTAGVMDNLGLGTKDKGMSVVQAVSAARTVTKLQYLTGAAPVVYGIPVYLKM